MLVLLGGVAVVGFGASAQAGCLSGAAIGGVAGHVVGHHGLLGAAVGCAVGHHRSEGRREQYDDRSNQQGGYQREGAYRTGPDRQTYGRNAYRSDEQR